MKLIKLIASFTSKKFISSSLKNERKRDKLLLFGLIPSWV